MFPVFPIAFTAALGTLVGLAAAKWWLDLLRNNGLLGSLAADAESAGAKTDCGNAAGEAPPQWLLYCPACRVHLVAETAQRCREAKCAFPG